MYPSIALEDTVIRGSNFGTYGLYYILELMLTAVVRSEMLLEVRLRMINQGIRIVKFNSYLKVIGHLAY